MARRRNMAASRVRTPASVSLTPYLDEAKKRMRQLLPDLRNMPEPTALDAYFIGVAEKHHGDVSAMFYDDDVP